MKKSLFLLSVTLLLVTGCSNKQHSVNINPSQEKQTLYSETEKKEILVKFERAVVLQKQRKYAEAIEVYDSLINYYRNRENGRGILSVVYINKFECSLLSNRGYDKRDLEDYLRRFGRISSQLMKFEILYILEEGKRKSMDSLVEKWHSKYQGQRLDGWTFAYIDDWIQHLENATIRNRLKRYVSIFKKSL